MGTSEENRAIIYVPDTPDRARWERLAVEYCERHHYRIAGLVVGRDDEDHWTDVVSMCTAGAVDVVVVGRRDQLPPHRAPRVEVITEDVEPPTRRGHSAAVTARNAVSATVTGYPPTG